VGLSFVLAALGDKTMLPTITLATDQASSAPGSAAPPINTVRALNLAANVKAIN